MIIKIGLCELDIRFNSHHYDNSKMVVTMTIPNGQLVDNSMKWNNVFAIFVSFHDSISYKNIENKLLSFISKTFGEFFCSMKIFVFFYFNKGACVNVKCEYGKIFLHLTCGNNHDEIVLTLFMVLNLLFASPNLFVLFHI